MTRHAEVKPPLHKKDQMGSFSLVRQPKANVSGACLVSSLPLVDEKGPTVNLVSMRMENHSGRSGYDRLLNYLESIPIVGSNSPTIPERIIGKLLKPLIKHSGSVWYHRANLLAELHAATRCFHKERQVFHFLYGENSFRYLGNIKRLRRRHSIFATYHTPPGRLKELVTRPAHIRRLDAAVVVSTVQRPFFERILGPERTIFVPHGIDTDYFAPGPKEKSDGPLRCIFVGSHLRDFDTLVKALPIILNGTQEVRLIVVTQANYRHHFAAFPSVDFHSGVSDEKLRALYRSADILLLPLLDCTANNALLEGMACGLPVVATDLQGVRDYAENECALLVQGRSPEALADAVFHLAEQPALRKRMGEASRRLVLRFAWPKIADTFKALYWSGHTWESDERTALRN